MNAAWTAWSAAFLLINTYTAAEDLKKRGEIRFVTLALGALFVATTVMYGSGEWS